MTSFEILVIVVSLGILYLLQRSDKNAWKKYLLTAAGVLLFEYFTQSLWFNNNLASWSYLYLDVNWVLTLGWTAIILVSVGFVDRIAPKYSDKMRYLLYIVVASVIGLIAESVVTSIGIREYGASTQAFLSGSLILGSVPVEAAYYIPVFMALVIAFKKYWEDNLELSKKPRRNK